MDPLLSAAVYVLIVLIVVGILLWGVTQLPIDAQFQRLIRVVAVVIAALLVVVLLLRALGVAVPFPR